MPLIIGKYSAVSPPGSISDLGASAISDTEIQLTFTNSANALSHEYRLGGGVATALAGNKIISGLTQNTPYVIEVRGVNTAGNGDWSNTANETTEALPGNTGALTGDALDDDQVQLIFTDAPYATSHDYRLNGGSAVTLAGTKIVSGLSASTSYDFEVRGVNSFGVGSWSNVETETTLGSPTSIANQTLQYGALTLANDGGAKALDNTGHEVDFTSVDGVVSGTGTGWSISGGRLIRSSTPATSNGAVLTCTTTLGQINVTISTEANTYDAADGDLAALLALGSTLAGKTIKGRPGCEIGNASPNVTPFGNTNGDDYGTSPGLTITSRDHDNQCYIRRFVIRNSGIISFSYLKIRDSFVKNGVSGDGLGAATMISFSAASPDVRFDHCELYGEDDVPSQQFYHSRGTGAACAPGSFVVDLSGATPVPDLSDLLVRPTSGANFQINNDAAWRYNITAFDNTAHTITVTDANATPGVSPATRFASSGNTIWAIGNILVLKIMAPSGANTDMKLTVTNCDLHDYLTAIAATGSYIHIENNDFDRTIIDHTSLACTGNETHLVVERNRFKRAYGRGFDPQNPHVDCMQLNQGPHVVTNSVPYYFTGNIIFPGVGRTHLCQGVFIENMSFGTIVGATTSGVASGHSGIIQFDVVYLGVSYTFNTATLTNASQGTIANLITAIQNATSTPLPSGVTKFSDIANVTNVTVSGVANRISIVSKTRNTRIPINEAGSNAQVLTDSGLSAALRMPGNGGIQRETYVIVEHNLMASCAGNGITIECPASGSIIRGNTLIFDQKTGENNELTGTPAELSPKISTVSNTFLTEDHADVLVEYNLTNAITTYLGTKYGNHIIANQLPTNSDYSAILVGSDFNTENIADIDAFIAATRPLDSTVIWGNNTNWYNYDTGASDAPWDESGFDAAGAFTDVTGASTSTFTASNEVTLTGVSATGALVRVTGGATFRVRDGSNNLVRDYSSEDYVVLPNHKVTIRSLSSVFGFTDVVSNIVIGTTSDTWTVTTGAAPSADSYEQKIDALFAGGSGTWTAPADISPANIWVRMWGAGGAAVADQGSGGGAAFAEKTSLSVTPSTGYPYSIGIGATSANGGDSTFNTTDVVAQGGKYYVNGSTGGTTGSSTGDNKFAGGNGAIGTGTRAAGTGAGDQAAGTTGGTTGGARNGGPAVQTNAGRPWGGGARSTAGAGGAGGPGHGEIIYKVPNTVGFAHVVDRQWGRKTAAATSHTVRLPTDIVAGDLIILLVASDGASVTISSSGYTSIASATDGAQVSAAALCKTASGSEGASDITVTTSASEEISWIVLSVRHGVTPTGTTSSGASTNASSPSHTPAGGNNDYLWLSFVGWDDNGNLQISSIPSNYNNCLIQPTGTAGGGVACAVCERRLTAASEDPGTFVVNTEQWVGITLSVGPDY